MIRKLLTPLADIFAHWRIGLMVATVVAGMLVLGLSMRSRYIVDAQVEIGRVIYPDSLNLMRHSQIEASSDIETFFLKEVFESQTKASVASCDAKANNFLERSVVRITCSGKDKELITEYVLSITKQVIERHAGMRQIAESINNRKMKKIDLQLQHIQDAINKLEENPVTVWSEARLIDHRLRMEGLVEEKEQIARIKFVNTQLRPEHISVLDRTPSFRAWLTVLVLSLFSGFFAAVFTLRTPLHKRIDHH